MEKVAHQSWTGFHKELPYWFRLTWINKGHEHKSTLLTHSSNWPRHINWTVLVVEAPWYCEEEGSFTLIKGWAGLYHLQLCNDKVATTYVMKENWGCSSSSACFFALLTSYVLYLLDMFRSILTTCVFKQVPNSMQICPSLSASTIWRFISRSTPRKNERISGKNFYLFIFCAKLCHIQFSHWRTI